MSNLRNWHPAMYGWVSVPWFLSYIRPLYIYWGECPVIPPVHWKGVALPRQRSSRTLKQDRVTSFFYFNSQFSHFKCYFSNFNFHLSDLKIDVVYKQSSLSMLHQFPKSSSKVKKSQAETNFTSSSQLLKIWNMTFQIWWDLAGLLGLAGHLDLSGLLILDGISWQLMQHS